MEFLVHMELRLPARITDGMITNLYASEARAAKPYLDSGQMARVWREPGTRNHYALWDVADVQAVHDAYTSFPMFPWMTVHVTPLCVNENDPGTPARERPDLKMTWACLSAYYDSQPGHEPEPGSPQAGRHEGKTVMLTDTVSIHMHAGAFPREIHFMCGDVKVAELGPDENLHGEPKAPRYVDILAEWDGSPVQWRKWKARVLADNKTLHPDYETALRGPRARF